MDPIQREQPAQEADHAPEDNEQGDADEDDDDDFEEEEEELTPHESLVRARSDLTVLFFKTCTTKERPPHSI